MPQMAPMNWLLLLIYFSMIFLILNSINFYSYLYTPQKSIFKKSFKIMNWKW